MPNPQGTKRTLKPERVVWSPKLGDKIGLLDGYIRITGIARGRVEVEIIPPAGTVWCKQKLAIVEAIG